MKNSSQQSEVNAHEVLSFPHAELQKNQDGKNKISSVGILSVLYFPDYNRYILYLEDWSYALLRRLPVVVSSHTSHDSRCYTFPAYTGDYIVKLNKISHPEGVQNFETILKNNSQFSYEGEEPRQRETSPSDKFNEFEEHGDSYKEKGATETGKLKAKEKVKKGFKKIKSKFTSHYSADQKCNLNLKQVKDYDQLKNSGVDPSHSHHKLGRKDVEAVIVRSKDIARARGYFIENPIQRQGKQEMQNSYEIKETIVKIPEEETYKLRAAQLIDEIENERRLQEIERRNQDSHRQMELFHVERERELQNSIRAQQQEKSTRQMEQMQQMERSLLSEVQRKEAILLEQEKLRREEALAFSKKEKQLQEELDFKFAQLLQKEEITEAERAELAAQIMRLRESEFLVLSQSQKQRNEEAERRQKELREKEIEIKMKEMQFENLCQQEAELLAQNEKLLQGHQKMDQEPWYMDQALLQKDSEFQTYSKSQDICQVTTSVERSQHKLGEIDLINRP